MIILSGLIFGIAPLLKLLERIRLLSELIHALEKTKAELNTNVPTIPQLVYSMEGSCELFNFINDQIEKQGPMVFYNAWHTCIQQERYLTPEEQNALHALGDTLGRYVIDDQLAAFDRTLPILKEGYTDAKIQLQSVSRLYIGTGLSLSAMLVVVLL